MSQELVNSLGLHPNLNLKESEPSASEEDKRRSTRKSMFHKPRKTVVHRPSLKLEPMPDVFGPKTVELLYETLLESLTGICEAGGDRALIDTNRKKSVTSGESEKDTSGPTITLAQFKDKLDEFCIHNRGTSPAAMVLAAQAFFDFAGYTPHTHPPAKLLVQRLALGVLLFSVAQAQTTLRALYQMLGPGGEAHRGISEVCEQVLGLSPKLSFVITSLSAPIPQDVKALDLELQRCLRSRMAQSLPQDIGAHKTVRAVLAFFIMGEKNDKNDKSDKNDKGDNADNEKRSSKTDKSDKNDKKDKGVKTEKGDKEKGPPNMPLEDAEAAGKLLHWRLVMKEALFDSADPSIAKLIDVRAVSEKAPPLPPEAPPVQQPKASGKRGAKAEAPTPVERQLSEVPSRPIADQVMRACLCGLLNVPDSSKRSVVKAVQSAREGDVDHISERPIRASDVQDWALRILRASRTDEKGVFKGRSPRFGAIFVHHGAASKALAPLAKAVEAMGGMSSQLDLSECMVPSALCTLELHEVHVGSFEVKSAWQLCSASSKAKVDLISAPKAHLSLEIFSSLVAEMKVEVQKEVALAEQAKKEAAERERKAKEEAAELERKAKDAAERERKAKLEEEKKAKQEEERKAKQAAEIEKKAKQEEERKAKKAEELKKAEETKAQKAAELEEKAREAAEKKAKKAQEEEERKAKQALELEEKKKELEEKKKAKAAPPSPRPKTAPPTPKKVTSPSKKEVPTPEKGSPARQQKQPLPSKEGRGENQISSIYEATQSMTKFNFSGTSSVGREKAKAQPVQHLPLFVRTDTEPSDGSASTSMGLPSLSTGRFQPPSRTPKMGARPPSQPESLQPNRTLIEESFATQCNPQDMPFESPRSVLSVASTKASLDGKSNRGDNRSNTDAMSDSSSSQISRMVGGTSPLRSRPKAVPKIPLDSGASSGVGGASTSSSPPRARQKAAAKAVPRNPDKAQKQDEDSPSRRVQPLAKQVQKKGVKAVAKAPSKDINIREEDREAVQKWQRSIGSPMNDGDLVGSARTSVVSVAQIKQTDEEDQFSDEDEENSVPADGSDPFQEVSDATTTSMILRSKRSTRNSTLSDMFMLYEAKQRDGPLARLEDKFANLVKEAREAAKREELQGEETAPASDKPQESFIHQHRKAIIAPPRQSVLESRKSSVSIPDLSLSERLPESDFEEKCSPRRRGSAEQFGATDTERYLCHFTVEEIQSGGRALVRAASEPTLCMPRASRNSIIAARIGMPIKEEEREEEEPMKPEPPQPRFDREHLRKMGI
eukprot:gnl/MRDRNA2_/MRDRNA2_107372_c0_seq1.p1 gnl/MRDRNA2_/MRDRNA2_107372_c0~~gnl/MRDRNA2_/MRDRNA2_107372_c0_seq1.p1  ORF type:complete len:1465 (-),score=358.48 gnl/MRDRNA2_/MRDRNA2_107372_c0_seq1:9-3869(-)